MVAIVTCYFRQIFESSNPEDIADALSEASTTITKSFSNDLTAPVTEWEVKLVLFAMHPDKSTILPKNWDIVKDYLTLMVY